MNTIKLTAKLVAEEGQQKMIEILTRLVIDLEDAMVTPISKDDLRYNDGIRTAIMIVQGARDKAYEDSKETEKK